MFSRSGNRAFQEICVVRFSGAAEQPGRGKPLEPPVRLTSDSEVMSFSGVKSADARFEWLRSSWLPGQLWSERETGQPLVGLYQDLIKWERLELQRGRDGRWGQS